MYEETENNSLPNTIEDAMRMVRGGNKVPADQAVGGNSMGEGGSTENIEDTSTQGEIESQARNIGSGDPEGQVGDSLDVGGSPDGSTEFEAESEVDETDNEQYDYDEIGRAYVKSAQQMAVQAANELFHNQNISKASINDLYERDDDGRVSFRNPDDPNHPFQSRAEAQQWCDAFNAQVEYEWKNTVMEYQRQYAKDIQPVLRTISFAPEYDSMSDKEKKAFDNIVSEYEIKDKSGMVIGYSCDLPMAKRMAMNIVNSIGPAEAEVDSTKQVGQAKVNGGGPATDAKTSGTGNPQNKVEEPKNLAEAMKLVAEQNKKKN